MKQQELMVGDYVMMEGDNHPHQIEWWADMSNAHLYEPIPITPEILEKNGFANETYMVLDLDDGKWLEYYHHEHRLRMWWRGIDEWENHSKVTELIFQCHVYYVHELQHALRLARIDKEIVL